MAHYKPVMTARLPSALAMSALSPRAPELLTMQQLPEARNRTLPTRLSSESWMQCWSEKRRVRKLEREWQLRNSEWVGGSQSKNRIGWEQSSDTDRSPGEPVPEDDAKDGGGEDDQPRNQGPHPQPGEVGVRPEWGEKRQGVLGSPRQQEGHQHQHLGENVRMSLTFYEFTSSNILKTPWRVARPLKLRPIFQKKLITTAVRPAGCWTHPFHVTEMT